MLKIKLYSKITLKYLYVILIFVLFSCRDKNRVVAIDDPIQNRVDSLMSMMTNVEKIGQLNLMNGDWFSRNGYHDSLKPKIAKIKNGQVGAILNLTNKEDIQALSDSIMSHSRLKIPLLFGYDVLHGYRTIFPIPLAESSSWNMDLIEKTARVAAEEATYEGINWTFAPMLDISRDARWGRIMEAGGEDPFLNGEIAVAKIKGFQSENLSNSSSIAACAKHFAGYGLVESGRDYNTVNIGEYELQNAVLPPFKAAANAGVSSFMTAFNELDGIPSTANNYLLRDVLKDDWNWKGFVVSDWESISEMKIHGYVSSKTEAAKLALSAGTDMDMESNSYSEHLLEGLKTNQIRQKTLDDAVRRILTVKFRLGLFDKQTINGVKLGNIKKNAKELNREIARKSIVLLKNENKLLPLKKTNQKIALIGPFVKDKDTPIGNWRAKAESHSATSVFEGFQSKLNKEPLFAKGATHGYGVKKFLLPLSINKSDKSDFTEAINIAKLADVVVMVLGEDAYQSGEGRSQVDIGLTGVQQELLEEVYKVNQNLVLVLMNGRPLEISWAAENVPAIVETWLLGHESGDAIADVLFGDYNPSGKLTVSFPRHVGQEPLYYNHKNTGRPTNPNHVTYSNYRDVDKSPLFVFGHGLSYTNFQYSALKLDSKEIKENGVINASVSITNTGTERGIEIVQWYIRDITASITRPVKELKHFELVELKPNETKIINFEINKDDLEFYTVNKLWEVEKGIFRVFVGGNSSTDNFIEFEYK